MDSVDVKYLKTYQQLAIYIFPIITNLAVIHPVVIFVRLRCFEARFKQVGECGMGLVGGVFEPDSQ